MKRNFLAAVLIVASMSGCGSKADPKTSSESAATPKDDVALIQGKWKPVLAIEDGQKVPEAEFARGTVEIAGDRMVFKIDGTVAEICKVSLDPKQEPKAIDLTVIDEQGFVQKLSDEKNRTIDWVRKGIYSVDGNQLKVCTPDGVGVPRPTQFDTLPGTGLTLMTFERVK